MLALTSSVETPFHRIPAAIKLACLAGFTAGVFLIERPVWMLGPVALVGVLHLVAGREFMRSALIAARPLWIFVAVIVIWHLALGEPAKGVMLTGRILATVLLANFVTMTTRLDEMTIVALAVLSPLRRLGVNTRAIAFSFSLVVRFTPVLRMNANTLLDAWRARSPRRANWRVLLPMTLIAIDDAERVAEALKARGGLPR